MACVGPSVCLLCFALGLAPWPAYPFVAPWLTCPTVSPPRPPPRASVPPSVAPGILLLLVHLLANSVNQSVMPYVVGACLGIVGLALLLVLRQVDSKDRNGCASLPPPPPPPPSAFFCCMVCHGAAFISSCLCACMCVNELVSCPLAHECVSPPPLLPDSFSREQYTAWDW